MEYIIVNGRRKYKKVCDICGKEFYRRCDAIQDKICTNCIRKKSSIIHGFARSRIHNMWTNMKNRCYGIASNMERDYKKRNITVCNEWKNDFMSFYNWAIHNGYYDNLTIDRINNDGNYEPNNCRFITNKEQQLNKRELISSNTSGYRYISYLNREKKWRFSYYQNRKMIISKTFKEKEDAILFRDNYLRGLNES